MWPIAKDRRASAMHGNAAQYVSGAATSGIGASEAVVGKDNGDRVVDVVASEKRHVVVERSRVGRIRREERQPESDVDGVVVALDHKSNNSRRALRDVDQGTLTSRTIRSRSASNSVEENCIVGSMCIPESRVGNKVGKVAIGGHGEELAQLWTHRFKNYSTYPVWFVQRRDL